MYKLPRYTHISNIELLLEDELDRTERQAMAVEYYHLVLDVLVKALNSREKVRHNHLGDLVHYAFHELTENTVTLNLLFDYTVELFVRVHRYLTRLGLEDFVHYRLTGTWTNILYGYDYIKIDFDATSAWLAVRQWESVQVKNSNDNNNATEGVGQVVCETPTQEQLDAIYDAQNSSVPIKRNRY